MRTRWSSGTPGAACRWPPVPAGSASARSGCAILAAHGITPRQRARTPADEAKVVAAYQRHHSVQLITAAFGLGHEKVRAILDAHGVELAPQPNPISVTWSGPASAKWITQAQAARLLRKSVDFVRLKDRLVRTAPRIRPPATGTGAAAISPGAPYSQQEHQSQ
jgi:hypothetical protein